MTAAKVKICGITRPEDARAAMEAGCDAIGLVLWPGSSRYVDRQRARLIREAVGGAVDVVGVFADTDVRTIADVSAEIGLTVVQYSGMINGDDWMMFARQMRLIRTVHIGDGAETPPHSFAHIQDCLLDTRVGVMPGGTGRSFDWRKAENYRSLGRIWLAGGLNPTNVVEAIRVARPYAVDVSSGVEIRPGVKSPGLIQSFVRAAKSVDVDSPGGAA